MKVSIIFLLFTILTVLQVSKCVKKKKYSKIQLDNSNKIKYDTPQQSSKNLIMNNEHTRSNLDEKAECFCDRKNSQNKYESTIEPSEELQKKIKSYSRQEPARRPRSRKNKKSKKVKVYDMRKEYEEDKEPVQLRNIEVKESEDDVKKAVLANGGNGGCRITTYNGTDDVKVADVKALAAIDEPESALRSQYVKDDDKLASGCPNRNCQCGGCKCGGCKYSSCKCNSSNIQPEVNSVNGGDGKGRNFPFKGSYKPSTATNGWNRDDSSLSFRDVKLASSCPSCGALKSSDCKCNSSNIQPEVNSVDGRDGKGRNFSFKGSYKPSTATNGWNRDDSSLSFRDVKLASSCPSCGALKSSDCKCNSSNIQPEVNSFDGGNRKGQKVSDKNIVDNKLKFSEYAKKLGSSWLFKR